MNKPREDKISAKEEEILVKKSLDYSTKDGIASTISGSAGSNFISPFAVALGASNFQIGLLSALPNLIPTELFTRGAIEKFTRKTLAMTGTIMQIISWILIVCLGLLFMYVPSLISILPVLLIILYTLIVSADLFMGPAWASWMKDLTEHIKLGKYFGFRNRVFGIIGLITIILAGLLLQFSEKAGYIFIGFAFLFVTAAVSRTISRHYIGKQYEPKLKLEKKSYFSFWQFIKKAPLNNYGKFAIFIALINMSVMIAGPFFTPYLLNGLKLSYMKYTIINLVISGAATFITMPYWGRFIDRYGGVKTMSITAWLVPIVPVLWLFSSNLYWLGFAQVFSGVVWAGFNLASGTFTYDAVTRERMSLCVAYSSVLNGIGIFAGALIGGLIASLHITFMNIFLFVFLISGIARFIVIFFMLPSIREVRVVKEAKPFLNIVLKPLREVHLLPIHHHVIQQRSVVNDSHDFFRSSKSKLKK